MDGLVIFNRNPMRIEYLLQEFDSFIVTEEYNGHGDFELILDTSPEIDTYLQRGKLINYGTEKYVRIETVSHILNSAGGFKTSVKGRTMESLLTQRVVWGRQSYMGSLAYFAKRLLTENFTEPPSNLGQRKMPYIGFEDTPDPRITMKPIISMYTGDNVYDILKKQCERFNVGFKFYLKYGNIFTFKLYCGDLKPNVEFSVPNENLVTYTHMMDYLPLKNSAIVGGYGDGPSRKFVSIGDDKWDEDRYETYIDEGKINPDLGNGNVMNDTDYTNLIVDEGKRELAQRTAVETLDTEIDPDRFVYGTDYSLGDTVYIRIADGSKFEALVQSAVISINEGGKRVLPKFKVVKKYNGGGGWVL